MSKNCPTCSAAVCEGCGLAIHKDNAFDTQSTLCWKCLDEKVLAPAERKPTWGYHEEIELWDGFNWQVTKLSEKFGVWYSGDWRTNYRYTGQWGDYCRRRMELTEVER